MKTAYLDCFSGISGDMFLGALLDAGLPFKILEKNIKSLPLVGFSLSASPDMRQGLSGTRFAVHIDDHKHEHRGLKDIQEIIESSILSRNVKDKSIRIFEAIASEEGRIHGLPPDQVHFHEVGAVDSIIDIVGAMFGLEYMNISSIYSSHLPLGSGFIDSRHGRIPVPAPATIALLKGAPVYDSGLKFELITPTGAAIIKELVMSFGSMPPMVVKDVGYGVGSRDLPDRPNLFRIIIGEDALNKETDFVVLLEANMDDSNPEWIGFLMEKLFEAGALDVAFVPVQMKKNRPGLQIQVMGMPHQTNQLSDIIFRESSSLGVRFRYSQRKILKRSPSDVDSPWGKIRVKKITQPDGSISFAPEYEKCKEIADVKNIPLKEVYFWVMSLNKHD